MFIQLVLQSYAVISLVKYSCMFAPIVCNKLCNKFVQWHDKFMSLFRQCFSWDPAQYLLTTLPGRWRRYESCCHALTLLPLLAVQKQWKVGGRERVWKETESIFYFVQRCTQNWHTVITEEQKQWRNITNSMCSCSQPPPQLCSRLTGEGGRSWE